MRKINLNIIFRRFNFTSEIIAKTVSFRRFKALSLLICIFVLFGCSIHNTGEKHTLIVTDARTTHDGKYIEYTVSPATRDESLSDVMTTARVNIQFIDEYGKFNIGDIVVIVKNNQYEK